MATMESALLRAARARQASRSTRAAAMASRSARAGAAAAAATRAAAMASRAARAAGVAAAAARAARWDSGVIFPIKSCPSRSSLNNGSTKPRDDARDAPCYTSSCADYFAKLSAKLSDRGIIPMAKDLESDEAVWALYERWCKTFEKKRDHAEMARRFKLFKHYAQYAHNWNTCVLARADITHSYDQYVPLQLNRGADGSDPYLSEYDKDLLKQIEEREQAGISTFELLGYGNPLF